MIRTLIICCQVGLVVAAAEAHWVSLQGRAWDILVEAETLKVIGLPKDGMPLTISEEALKSSAVADIQQDANYASWRFPGHGVVVEMRLDDKDMLLVRMAAAKEGAFTWPVQGSVLSQFSYVLPMYEGLYIPEGDTQWSAFLSKQGPLNTTGDLSMPFWAIIGHADPKPLEDLKERLSGQRQHSVTFILTNPFNNQLEFRRGMFRFGLRLTHTFTRNHPVKEFGYRIQLGDGSPITPARLYRQYLIDTGQFVTLQQKIDRAPEVSKLLGAAHVYLWGDGIISAHDIKDYKQLAERLLRPGATATPSVSKRIWTLMSEEVRTVVAGLASKQWVDDHDRRQIATQLDACLRRADFYDPAAWQDTAIPDEAKALLADKTTSLSKAQIARLNSLLLQAAFPDLLAPVNEWGDGFSTRMLQEMADAGLDRLWLGSPTWDGLAFHPGAVQKAMSLGYLIGPYDSYHSIHSPKETDTWETAQFDERLYQTGAVVNVDGSKRAGFKQKGFVLSPLAARPYMQRRVSRLMQQFHCNSWFIDGDAFGDVFDDYSDDHPATQEEDTKMRLGRLAWIRDTFGAVIGSEGGSAYAAGTLHFAHGIMTPVIGWGDADLMKHQDSKYYLGSYYPPEEPAVFFKQVPLKPEYARAYADPRFRLPLYDVVFHDSVVATHQWGFGSFKFDDPNHARELLELLYSVPPLYHLNLKEWAKRKHEIVHRFEFFSPLHRETALRPMTDFAWLTGDHLVQRTRFAEQVELIANFSDRPYRYDGDSVPAHSLLAKWPRAGKTRLYSPASAP